MNKDNLRERACTLKKQAEELISQLNNTYELTAESTSPKLKFNTLTDLFTEEERTINTKLEKLIIRAMELEGDISDELYSIETSQRELEGYNATLIENAEDKYSKLFKDIDKIYQTASETTKSLEATAKQIQPIACERYFERLNYRELVNETIELSKNFAIVDTGDFLESEELLKDSKIGKALESIKATYLFGRYANDYYSLALNAIVPTARKMLTEEGLKEFIKERIEPCFESHIEAIKALKLPTGEAERNIKEAVERVYSSLDFDDEKKQETPNSLAILAPAFNSYFLPRTHITRELFDGKPLKDKKNVPVKYFYDAEQHKDINTYLTVSGELKGVKGLECYGLEELCILAGLITRIRQGDNIITPLMIKKGRLQGSKVSMKPNEEQRYIEVLEDFRNRDITIDQREYIGKVGLNGEKILAPYKTTKIIKADVLTDKDIEADVENIQRLKINGQEIKYAYEITETGALLDHIFFTGQYYEVPADIARIEGLSVKYDWLRYLLIDEILRIKNDIINTETEREKEARIKRELKKAEKTGKEYKERKAKQKPVITFEYIYSKAPKYPERSRDKEAIQKETQNILSHLKTKGFIEKYKPLREGLNRKRTKKEDNRKKSTLLDAVEISVRKSDVELL